ncbi:Abi family protein [Pseudomonas sp. LJDD11]|uniref:Abi family protein n=1 Tax=unclassified Pseudomonas TaxID=196821 RepID=UPI002096C952|nr:MULTISPECIES: Abi family protein [unclassified Pseudomonas]MCO8163868.1 Abi family protein [Pseudomonas sp. 21LCFQ010]MCQ9422333.1 Abi family protein [Pseudomonas sp. LJDD11]
MSVDDAKAVELALSRDRLSTYLGMPKARSTEQAIRLYVWNAQVSGALMLAQQVCEVVVRNAVSDALSAVYGNAWPWAAGFERSLPGSTSGFSLKNELCAARSKATPGRTSTVVAELKFAFWIRLFAHRFESRVWASQIHRMFPGLPQGMSVTQCRETLYNELESVRSIRNRIAHHEPIFARNLLADYERMHRLVAWRCPRTAAWLENIEAVRHTVLSRP